MGNKTKADFEVPMPILRPVRIVTTGMSWWQRARVHFKSRNWEVYEDYTLYIPWLDIYLFIPKGFIFDGASVPRILWPLLNPTGILLIGSIFHDFGYGHNYLLDRELNKIYNEEDQAFFDDLFRDINIHVNGIHTMNNLAYDALYLFGRFAWKKCRKEELTEKS
jgi:hypothetical protein